MRHTTSETLISLPPVRESVGFLQDQEVREALDDLLSSAATSSDRLMTRLIGLGWKPSGEAHPMFFGLTLFIMAYNDARDNSDDIDDCLLHARAVVLGNPNIARVISQGVADGVDRQMGAQS